MADLLWHDFLEIGVEFIDDDHKNLLRIMREIKAAIEAGDKQQAVELLATLLEEARAHFDREEKFLQKIDYPSLESHKKYHQKLLVKAEETRNICAGLDAEYEARECFNSMANFIIDDILRGDIKFKSFLEYEGHSQPHGK